MREAGRRAEEKAVSYLLKRGFEILERNYSTRFGEIDIVAREGSVLVFVEVKSRNRGDPELSFTPSKARKLYKTAMIYLASKGLLNLPIRFDLIAISGSGLAHYENILGEGGIIVG